MIRLRGRLTFVRRKSVVEVMDHLRLVERSTAARGANECVALKRVAVCHTGVVVTKMLGVFSHVPQPSSKDETPRIPVVCFLVP